MSDVPTAARDLALTPPAAVEVVTDEQAVVAVDLGSDDRQRLRDRAATFVAELMSLESRSPDFAHKVASLTSMGEQDVQAAAALSSRVIIRPASGATSGGGDAQTRVAATLARLREIVRHLEPSRAHLSGVRKVWARFSGSDAMGDYFDRFRSSQVELNTVITALATGQDDLRRDNATIDTEKATMWATLTRLSEYHELASALDDRLAAAVVDLEAAGRVEDAASVRSEAVFALRERRQDLTTQQAITLHGFLALDLVRRTNLDLIRGVDRAQRTTIVALRTARSVSRAVRQQELVLEQIAGLDAATTALAESNIGSAATTEADVARLQRAFDDVFTSLDDLSSFQDGARSAMESTRGALAGRSPTGSPPTGNGGVR